MVNVNCTCAVHDLKALANASLLHLSISGGQGTRHINKHLHDYNYRLISIFSPMTGYGKHTLVHELQHTNNINSINKSSVMTDEHYLTKTYKTILISIS